MNPPGKNGQFLRAVPLVLLMLLCACEKAPAVRVSADDDKTLPPPIVPPAEVAHPADRPSYEVGIATAAAERNQAKEKCVEMPEAERELCEAEADLAFATAEANLDDLRGNQQ